MYNCTRCKKLLPSEDYAACTECGGLYHLDCSLPENNYKKLLKKQKDWKSSKCVQGVSTRNMEEQRKQDKEYNNEDLVEVKKSLAEMNMKFNELLDMKNGLLELTKTINFLAEKYDTLIKELDTVKTENKNAIKQIEELKNANKDKDQIIADLEERTENLEQYTRNHNIEIHGIPQKQNEDCKNLLLKIAQELDIDMNMEEMDVAHRVAVRRATTALPIVAQLTTRTKRDELVKQKVLIIMNNNIEGLQIGQKMFISEHLTLKNKNLLRLAKIRARELNYKYVWYKFGKVLVRKNDNTQVIRINNTYELETKLLA